MAIQSVHVGDDLEMPDSQSSPHAVSSSPPPASQAAPQAAITNPIQIVQALNPALQGVDNPDIDEGIYELATGGMTRDNSDSGSDVGFGLDLDSECESDNEMVVVTKKDIKRLKFLENFHEEVSNYQDANQRQINEVRARLAMEKTDREELEEKLKAAREDMKAMDNRIARLEAQLMASLIPDPQEVPYLVSMADSDVEEVPLSPQGRFGQDGEDESRNGG